MLVHSICLVKLKHYNNANIKDFLDIDLSQTVKEFSINSRLEVATGAEEKPPKPDLQFKFASVENKDLFDELNELEEVNLMSCGISKLDIDTFIKLKALRVLNLSNNKIDSLSKVFSGLEELEILDLSQNSISNINELAFNRLGKLRFLNLNENNISHLEIKTFQGLNELELLDISNNKLTTIESGRNSS